MAVETAVQLAERLAVQPSSLVRFAQALGYRGFNEMKSRFRAHLIFRIADTRDQEAMRRGSGTASNEVLGNLLDEGRAELEWLAAELSQREFQKAVSTLIKADQIYVVAQQIAFPFATLFAWTLLRFGRSATSLTTPAASRSDSPL